MSAAEERWWLSRTGTAEGPYGAAYVAAGLQTGTIQARTQACPVGGSEWRPLAEWPDFAEALAAAPPPPLRPGWIDRLQNSALGNAALPPMANAICLYAVLAAPLIWAAVHSMPCLFGISSLRETSRFRALDIYVEILDMLRSLATTAVVSIGGWKLRALRRSAPTWLLAGLWSGLGLGLVMLLISIGLGLVIDEADQVEWSLAQVLLFIPILGLGFADLVFMIVALVWLHRHAKELPLDPELKVPR